MSKHKPKQTIDHSTGEILEASGVLNEPIIYRKKKWDGTLAVSQSFDNCPTMAEQHTAHLSDLNYLMERYQPDELAAYIAARAAHKQEILGHDFSKEPDLTGAKNVVYQLKQNFEALPDEVKKHFKNHVEFLKFIDNPANAEKMLKLGLMTKREVAQNQTPIAQSTELQASKPGDKLTESQQTKS